MELYNLFFQNEHTMQYVESEGYNLKSQVLKLISEGDTKRIYPVARQYCSGITELLKPMTIDECREITFYVYAQVSAVATNAGLDDREAMRIKRGYYLSIGTTTAPDNFAELIREFIIDFTYAVYRKKNYSGYSPFVQSVIDYINENIQEKISVPAIADALYCSESSVSHRFSSEVGMPIKQYILQQKIVLSKVLIRQCIPISDIAFQMGFSSQSHFSRVFRDVTGKTPLEWKQQSIT